MTKVMKSVGGLDTRIKGFYPLFLMLRDTSLAI
jgi:hypothetical protein